MLAQQSFYPLSHLLSPDLQFPILPQPLEWWDYQHQCHQFAAVFPNCKEVNFGKGGRGKGQVDESQGSRNTFPQAPQLQGQEPLSLTLNGLMMSLGQAPSLGSRAPVTSTTKAFFPLLESAQAS